MKPPSWVTDGERLHRTADLSVDVEPGGTGVTEHWIYRLSMSASDPLVDEIRKGAVSSDDIITYVLGGPEDLGLPALDAPAGSKNAVAVFDGTVDYAFADDPANSDELDLFTTPPSTHGQPITHQLVDTMTISVSSKHLTVVQVTGRIPDEQSAHTITFSHTPTDVVVILQDRETSLASTGSDSSSDSNDSNDSNDSSDSNDFSDSTSSQSGSDLSSLYYPLAVFAPWLFLLITTRRATTTVGRTFYRLSTVTTALGLTISGLVYISLQFDNDALADGVYAIVSFGIPIAAYVWARQRVPQYRPPRALVAIPFALGASLALVTIIRVASWRADAMILPVVSILVAGITFGTAALIWSGSIGAVISGSLVGCGFALAVCGGEAFYLTGNLPVGTFDWMIFGVSWIPISIVTADLLFGQHTRLRLMRVLTAIVTALLLVPIVEVAIDPSQLLWAPRRHPVSEYVWYAVDDAMIVINLILAAGILWLLRRWGLSKEWTYDPLSRPIAAVLAMLLILSGFPTSIWAVASVGLAAAAFLWLLPRSRFGRASRLSRVSRRGHRRLVAAESWRRVTMSAGIIHYHDAKKGLARDPRTANSRLAAQTELDFASRKSADKPTSVSLTEAALGTSAGFTATANGRAAAYVGGALSVPIAAYEVYSFISRENLGFIWTADWLDFTRSLLRFAGYAFIYGYFYPFIRGTSPVFKAMALLTAILLPEVANFLIAPPSSHVVVALIALVCQLAVFCLGIGLYWELRLVHAADMLWGRIRDLRNLRSIGTPFTTLLITLVAAVATAYVGAKVGGSGQTSPTVSPPGQSASPSPSTK